MNGLGEPASSPPTKTSLTSWWRQFKLKQPTSQTDDDSDEQSRQFPLLRPHLRHMSHSSGHVDTMSLSRGRSNNLNNDGLQIPSNLQACPIFGVDLHKSIKYAHVSISFCDSSGEQFVYGYIPIVVAKCGVYLKKNATTVAGIFRLSGSARRIRDLQNIFNTPPKFGKNLDWNGYNVHDAANVLRRYLNNLPEPIIPLQFYEQFRDPLRARPGIVEYFEARARSLTQSGGGNIAETKSNNMEVVLTPGEQPERKGDRVNKIQHEQTTESILNKNSKITTGTIDNLQSSTGGVANDANIAAVPTPKINDSHDTAKDLTSELDESIMNNSKESENLTPQSSKNTLNKHQVEPGTQLYEDINTVIERYEILISQLPLINRQLLMYILDLLAVFAAKSDENLMPAPNLAAIFQPSILTHPNHDMSPEEYQLSRAAVEFLIEHSSKFLSHIESIAIKEYDKKKASSHISSIEVMEDHKESSNHLLVPQRRHSKSLSSVGAPDIVNQILPPPSSLSAARVPSRYQSQQMGFSPGESLNYPKLRPGSDNKTSPTISAINTTEMESHHGGILSSLRRSVSFNRKTSPPQYRSVSESSASSSTSRIVKSKAGSPNEEHENLFFAKATSTAKVLENVGQKISEDNQNELLAAATAEKRPNSFLSSLRDRRSRSPTTSEHRQVPPYEGNLTVSNLSIDQALAASPPLSATSSEMNNSANSPRFRSFNAVFSGNRNDSNCSIDKPLSELSQGFDSDEEASSIRPNEIPSSPRKNISKWRRSLLIFGTNNGEGHGDLTIPVPDNLSPSSSPGTTQSPSRSNWFRKITTTKTPSEISDDQIQSESLQQS